MPKRLPLPKVLFLTASFVCTNYAWQEAWCHNNMTSIFGIVPKISAYIGTPAAVAIITPKDLPVPGTRTIKFSSPARHAGRKEWKKSVLRRQSQWQVLRYGSLWQRNRDGRPVLYIQ